MPRPRQPSRRSITAARYAASRLALRAEIALAKLTRIPVGEQSAEERQAFAELSAMLAAFRDVHREAMRSERAG